MHNSLLIEINQGVMQKTEEGNGTKLTLRFCVQRCLGFEMNVKHQLIDWLWFVRRARIGYWTDPRMATIFWLAWSL